MTMRDKEDARIHRCGVCGALCYLVTICESCTDVFQGGLNEPRVS